MIKSEDSKLSYEEKLNKWNSTPKDRVMLSGFIKMDNTLVREIIHVVGLREAMAYYVILSHRNNFGGDNSCFPSFDTLATELNVSKSSVILYVNKLVDAGYLIINSGGNRKDNWRTCNTYFFPKEEFFHESEITGKRRHTNLANKPVRDAIDKSKETNTENAIDDEDDNFDY